jgi:hypothetical protein
MSEQEHFIASLPLYTLADPVVFQQHGLPYALVTLKTPEHGKLFPLFTDDDLAKRLAKDLPLPGKVPLEIKTFKALRTFLGDFQKIGGQYVGLDLGKLPDRFSGRFIPVQEIIDAIPADPAD